METSSNKDNLDLDYSLNILTVDVELFGLNAAAILSVIKAGEEWRIETNYRNKLANDVAEKHGDNRWLPEDVSVGFTNQRFIKRTFGLCGRNGVIDAIKLLESYDVVSHHTNPNKNYNSDKSRYFCFHKEVYDSLVRQFKEGTFVPLQNAKGHETDLSTEEVKVETEGHRLNLNDAPFKNKRKKGENRLNLNGDCLNPVSHIMYSNNKYKNTNQSINARANNKPFFEKNPLANHDSVQPIIMALLERGMPVKRFYPEAIDDIHRLSQAGATVAIFLQAYDLSLRVTQDRGFGVPYLVKVVEGLLSQTKQPISHAVYSKDPPPKKDRFSETVYESDTRNARKWMKGEDKCKQPEEQK